MIINDNRNVFQKAKVEGKRKADELKWKGKQVVNWVKENPRDAVLIATFVVTTIGGVAKAVSKAEEKHDMRTRVWDPVNGVYYHTKHEMSNRQKLEFEDRVSRGEQRGTILDDMGLLRRW